MEKYVVHCVPTWGLGPTNFSYTCVEVNVSKITAPGSRIVGAHILAADGILDKPWNDLAIGDGISSPAVPEYELATTPSGYRRGTIEALVKKIDELELRIIALEP